MLLSFSLPAGFSDFYLIIAQFIRSFPTAIMLLVGVFLMLNLFLIVIRSLKS